MSITFPPRGTYARLPTPVHKLERLSEELGIELFVKRDDQTGFEVSGNKVRKLDFLIQDALNKGATCLVTCGGVQSNHCRATAAMAARLGLRCVLLLRGEAPNTATSNNLLARLFGAEIFYLSSEQYYEGMGDFRQALEEQIRGQGGKTYFIPEGGSNALGAFGYAAAFEELEGQRLRGEISGLDASQPFDSMIIAHGSGGTQAGLILGKLGAGAVAENTRIVGMNVCYDAADSRRMVKDALWQCIQQYRLPLSFAANDLEVKEGALGRGYGLSTPEELKFIAKVARTEGMLVDPVYTGKALFGFYRAVKEDRDAFGARVLFWHTGGGFGLFKLGAEWEEAL